MGNAQAGNGYNKQRYTKELNIGDSIPAQTGISDIQLLAAYLYQKSKEHKTCAVGRTLTISVIGSKALVSISAHKELIVEISNKKLRSRRAQLMCVRIVEDQVRLTNEQLWTKLTDIESIEDALACIGAEGAEGAEEGFLGEKETAYFYAATENSINR